MKFATDRPFANLDAAVKKLLEIANGLEADHAGWLNIGTINREFFERWRKRPRIRRRGEGGD
jgi:hypothetical protein